MRNAAPAQSPAQSSVHVSALLLFLSGKGFIEAQATPRFDDLPGGLPAQSHPSEGTEQSGEGDGHRATAVHREPGGCELPGASPGGVRPDTLIPSSESGECTCVVPPGTLTGGPLHRGLVTGGGHIGRHLCVLCPDVLAPKGRLGGPRCWHREEASGAALDRSWAWGEPLHPNPSSQMPVRASLARWVCHVQGHLKWAENLQDWFLQGICR